LFDCVLDALLNELGERFVGFVGVLGPAFLSIDRIDVDVDAPIFDRVCLPHIHYPQTPVS
jgi:hypothetical protein